MHPARGLIAELWERPRWLIIGFVVAILAAASRLVSVGVLPPSITLNQIAHATATTELLVAERSSVSALTYRDGYFNSFLPRAQTLADTMASPEVRRLIARAAGIPAAQLAVDPPLWTNLERIQQFPSPEQRESQIIVENVPYRITVGVEPDAPVIDITAQAPTTKEAAALAAGAGRGLNAFVSGLETSTPPSSRYQVTQPVPITHSATGKSGPANIAAFTFAVVLFIWCGAMLFLSGLAEDLRTVLRRAKVPRGPDRSFPNSPALVDPVALESGRHTD